MALFSKKHSTSSPRRRMAQQRVESPMSESAKPKLFQRNRTLTGSTSSKITGTSELQAQLKSTRVQAHELAQKRRHIGGVLLLVLISCGVLYILISQFTAGVVVQMRSNGVVTTLESKYEEALQAYFGSQPIERLRFLINRDHFAQFVQAELPEVASIEADGSAGFGKSAFIVTMRRPVAGWTMNSRQQYVDANGITFEHNYFAPPAVQIVDNSGVPVQSGQAVASNRLLGFVGRAVGLSRAAGYNVTHVIIPASTTREVQLKLEGVSYPVKLSVDRSAGEQAEDMARGITWFKANERTPEYLDVRVKGEAFYR